MTWFGIASYGAAGLIFAAMTAIVLISRPHHSRTLWLVGAVALTVPWAGGLVVLSIMDAMTAAWLLRLDAVHGLAWTGAALSLLAPAKPGSRTAAGTGLLVAAALLTAWILLATSLTFPGSGGSSPFLSVLGIALVGLLSVEQVYRNARESQRGALGMLCFAIGGMFVADLFVYSQAVLLGEFEAVVWESRGLVNAVLGVFVVVALKRQPEWESELFVSRQVAFYTSTLLGVGAYLLVMAGVAYTMAATGSRWSYWIGVPVLAAALAVLVFLVYSPTVKARLKVFIVKHFYKNKYDYRHEWLRLTERLGRTNDSRELVSHALHGLAGIVGSERGELWITHDEAHFERADVFGEALTSATGFSHDHPIVAFLDAHRWVIDTDEYNTEPDRYGSAFGAPADRVLPASAVIVPLDCQGRLLGFAVLSRPPEVTSLNFEDHDVLKTAGKQVAIVLAQSIAQEKLAETRQFEAMNKLSTFLMHDLKNLVAQQELVVANARRFKDRPEFVEDAVETIRSGAARMRKVLEQLKSGETEHATRRIDTSKLVMEVRSHCADREPTPEIDLAEAPAWISMDREKLVSILTHLIRNAQDATSSDGRIDLRVAHDTDALLISVTDTGQGMDPEFVRDRLFKPFDTTHGAKGMGIGAYQVREIVRAMGGDVDVRTRLGEGTTFRLRIPGVLVGTPGAQHGASA